MRGAVGVEDKGHVSDALAVQHGLHVQCDMTTCLVIMLLHF